MKYTDEGLEEKIEGIIKVIEEGIEKVRTSWKEKDKDFLLRASVSMVLVSLMMAGFQRSCMDILGDLTGRVKKKNLKREKIQLINIDSTNN